MYFLWYLLIGLAAGWIASLIFKGSGSGLLVNLIVGLVGGFLGGWLVSLFGWVPTGTFGILHSFGHRGYRAAVDRIAVHTAQNR